MPAALILSSEIFCMVTCALANEDAKMSAAAAKAEIMVNLRFISLRFNVNNVLRVQCRTGSRYALTDTNIVIFSIDGHTNLHKKSKKDAVKKSVNLLLSGSG